MSPRVRSRGPARRPDDGGYALLSVLIVVGMVSLMVSALLGLLFTVIISQDRAATDERELRSLDSAMDAAVNQLRFDVNSASRDACRLEPPVQRIDRLVFDNDTADTGDDMPIDVECQGVVNTSSTSTADQVRLVGRNGYSSTAIPWLSASWPSGVTGSGLAATKPNLIHLGASPLQFGSGVTVRNNAAVLANTATPQPPAVEVAGEYVQGGAGAGATGTGCGQLAALGRMRIVDLLGASSPECGVPADQLQLDEDPTSSIAGFPRPTASPASVPACGAAVVTLVPGRYNANDMWVLNQRLNRNFSGASTCPATTFHFTPGTYVFTGDQLVFDRPDAYFVMGAPRGWTSPAGVDVSAAKQEVGAELCDTTKSGVTFVLPPQFRLEHRSGRLSMCPAFSDNPGQPALPAIYQETSYQNRLIRTPTWTRSFRPSNNALFQCANTSLTLMPGSAWDGNLDVLDPAGTGARPGGFAAADQLNAVGSDQCRVGRTHTVQVDTLDPRELKTARLVVRGLENPSTSANLITDRQIMVTVRKGAQRICTTAAQPGIGNGQWEASIDLMTGSCKNPRACGAAEAKEYCYDPRKAVTYGAELLTGFLPARSTNIFSNTAPNAEQKLTAGYLADAYLEITQFVTFTTRIAGLPVYPEQTYTINDVQLITNEAATAVNGPVSNGATELPFKRGFDDVGAVAVAAGIATPQMPDNAVVTASGLQTQSGTPCGYLLCPVVVPDGTKPTQPFVHSVNLGETSVQVPSEYTAANVDPNLSALRVRMKLQPDYCPTSANSRCPLMAPIEVPILGPVSANDYIRQSYPGTEVKAVVHLTTHAGTRCVEATGILGATTDVSVNLEDANRIVHGPGCDDVRLDTMGDLRLTAAPAANGANKVRVSVDFELPCLRDWFANAAWRCVHWNDAGRNVALQVRPPSIQQITLDVASDTITAAAPTSRLTIDARTPAPGVSTTSANIYGKVWMPRANLDLFWNGDVTEGRPVVQDELVVGALGSQITAAPRRSQAGVSAEDRYLVCCKSRQSESRDVRLVATAPSGKQLTAQVHFIDVVVDETPGSKRYFPGYQVQVRDWQTCDEGRCEPG